jgi:hypothetical protein
MFELRHKAALTFFDSAVAGRGPTRGTTVR